MREWWQFAIVLGGASVAFLGFAVWQGRALLQKARLMEDTPTTPCGDVEHGLVEVKGAVSPLSEPLVSPMEQTPCVYYRFKVEEQVSAGKSHHWNVIIDESSGGRALLEDETGAVWVDLDDAQLELTPTSHRHHGTFSTVPPELEQLLAERGMSGKGRFFSRTMRYEETTLRVGQWLYALGTASPGQDFPRLERLEDGILVVADRSEEALVRRLRHRAYSQIALGVVGVLVSLQVLVWGLF